MERSVLADLYSFRIGASIHHYVEQFEPISNPRFLQMLYYDPQAQLKRRQHFLQGLQGKDEPPVPARVIQQLQNMLREINPYYHTFEFAAAQKSHQNLNIVISESANKDRRIYNRPMGDELAIILNLDSAYEPRQIIVKLRGGGTRRISEFHASYDALHYVLMHPYGENGYQQNIPLGNSDSTCVSVRQYYSYHFQIRDVIHFQLYGRLFHQFCISMYVKVITEKLTWFRYNQNKFRYELYSGLEDASVRGDSPSNIGMKMILPNSFIGGPRHYRELYLNTLEVVRTIGTPTLTLTITCNPNWQEIQENLKPGQCANDRPDLAVRVFFQKLKQLKHEIVKNKKYGKVIAYTHVIEFQKRGTAK